MDKKYRIIARDTEKNEIVASEPNRRRAIRHAKFLVNNYPVVSVFVRHTEKPGHGGIYYWVNGVPEKGYENLLRDAVK